MNIFEQASIHKIRFTTVKGDLTTEQLWDLPLTSKGSFDLDTVAKTVNTSLKATAEESFVATSVNPARDVLELKLEIVKHIISVRLAQNAQLREASARASECVKLLDVLAKKQDAALEALTPEEIQDRLKALSS